MNGAFFMVMAATGKGWHQVSSMCATREEAEDIFDALRDGNLSLGRDTAVKGMNIKGMALRIFEVR